MRRTRWAARPRPTPTSTSTRSSSACQRSPEPTLSIRATASSAENADFAQAVIDAGLTWIGPPPDGDPQARRQGAGPRTSPSRPARRWCPAPPTRSTGADEVRRLRRRVRPPDRDQGGVRRRRARAEGRPRRSTRWPSSTTARCARRSARSAAASASSSATSTSPAARRDAGPRRQPRQRRRRRHPRLLAAAAPPEAGRGSARAVPHRRADPQPFHRRPARRSAARPATSAPARASSWSASDGADLLPRGQHPAAGRAPGDRGDDRGSTSSASSSASPTARSWAYRRPAGPRARDRVPHQRRGPRPRLPAGTRNGHPLRSARRPGVRVDSGIEAGSVIGGAFDSLLAKIIVVGASPATEALERPARALDELVVEGMATALPFHHAVVRDPAFIPKTPRPRSRCTTGGSRPSSTTRSRRSADPPLGRRGRPTASASSSRSAASGSRSCCRPGWRRGRGRAGNGRRSGHKRAGHGPAPPPGRRADQPDAGHHRQGGGRPRATPWPRATSIVVLEAMKMEQPLTAHKAGTMSGSGGHRRRRRHQRSRDLRDRRLS